MQLPELSLKTREERRLRAGHLWVFSNEVDTAKTPLTAFAPGALCRIVDARGKPLGVGYVNPRTLLAARVLSGTGSAEIGAAWMERRVRAALALRERLYPSPFYRLVFGESDGLPGLVVDRYGDVLVAQIGTAGIENLKGVVLDALRSVLAPRGVWLRNDGAMRELEGLPLYTEAVGDVPESVELEEGGARFRVALRSGQKTGWFFDQRDNRDRLARYAPGRAVLDAYSYAGAWAVRALRAGAKSALCLDSSEPALAAARDNAAANGLSIEAVREEALDALRGMVGEGRRFDLVILDPPALIKRKKDQAAGAAHYGAINRAGLELLAADGILVSCSCSQHLEAGELQRILLRESRAVGRRVQVLEQSGQGPDHPVHPAIPETRYLKAFFCRVT